MKNYTYHFEVESIVAQFMAALDDIIIKRYKKDRTEESSLKVRFAYAPKSRVLADLTDKAQNIQLPVIAVSIGGIQRDTSRVYNKLDGATFAISPLDSKNRGFMPQPLPVNITINVDFIAKYQRDIDQIITNFIPYCDPYFVISWRIKEMNDHEIRSICEWSGSVNVEYPKDISSSTNVRVTGGTTFTIKAWLFKPITVAPLIFDITTNFADIEVLKDAYINGVRQDDIIADAEYMSFTIKGTPRPGLISPNHFLSNTPEQTLELFGSAFKEVRNVYLSGVAVSNLQTVQTPFSGNVGLSAMYPSFTGVKLSSSDYLVVNENKIDITIPFSMNPGMFDIVVENIAGYQSLSNIININNDKYIYTTNPVMSGGRVVYNNQLTQPYIYT
jgi:hypothetical protein